MLLSATTRAKSFARSFPACGDASISDADAIAEGVFLPRVRGCFSVETVLRQHGAVPSPRAGMLPVYPMARRSRLCSFPACGDASLRRHDAPADDRFLPRVRGCFMMAFQRDETGPVPSPRAGMLPTRQTPR